MIFPNIHNYTEYKSYFAEFYEMNKNAGSPISFRFLAKKLNWPFSYLSDVIHERKPLSIPRALEFAKFSNLDSVGTERLIYMCFTSFSNENIKEFFSDKLSKELNSDMDGSKEKFHAGLGNDAETCIEELKGDLAASALLKLLDLCRGKIQKNLVGDLLHSFEELKDPKVVDQKLDYLRRNGNIKIKTNNEEMIEVELLKSVIHFRIDYSNKDISALFTDNESKLIRSKYCAGGFNNGFIKVERDRYVEILLKMSQLRNWFLELDKESRNEDSLKSPDTLIFQYSINICSLINVQPLGYPTLREWYGDIPPTLK